MSIVLVALRVEVDVRLVVVRVEDREPDVVAVLPPGTPHVWRAPSLALPIEFSPGCIYCGAVSPLMPATKVLYPKTF